MSTEQAKAMTETTEPRRWLYALTADEWLHLAAEGQDSEVAPCCGDIGSLREWLNTLVTSQDGGFVWLAMRPTLEAYESAADSHDVLRDAKAFPLLHRVLAGIREQIANDSLPPLRAEEPARCSDGLAVDDALGEIMELVRVRPGDDVLRADLRRILGQVRTAGYAKGTADQYA